MSRGTPPLQPCPGCGAVRRVPHNQGDRMCKSCAASVSLQLRHSNLDDVMVQRLTAGAVRSSVISLTTRAERQAAVAELDRQNYNATQIAQRLGVSVRTVVRMRTRTREENQDVDQRTAA